jgi:hypothetical protein
MVFELNAQFIEESSNALAERRGSLLIVSTSAGTRPARDLSRAIKIACEEIGPLMERGDKVGEGWGLLVTAGAACVAYGNWPAGSPREPGPELEGLRQILAEYRPGDGARAALGNAIKVVEAFAERRHHPLRKAA